MAAFLDVIEIDHERPGALAERRCRVLFELVVLEVIGVRLELLRDLVVLALARLGELGFDAHRAADALVEKAYCLLAAYEVAGAAPGGRGNRPARVACPPGAPGGWGDI